MRVLLLSAYDAASHKHWRTGLQETISDFAWTTYVLPPRNFSWRIKGNALSWAGELQRELETQHFDAVLCTSMVDLATLRGLVPRLSSIPTAVYFHENQFEYPDASKKRRPDLELLSIYTALCADKLVFNSRFNRDSMLQGVQRFLKMMPDCIPDGVHDEIQGKSEVIPVGIAPFEAQPAIEKGPAAPLRILWNHRWEYDKAPERFFSALYALDNTGVDFVVDVLGQRFRNLPDAFVDAKDRLAHRIGRWGFVDRETYQSHLREADVVVSTAIQEFQGLAVLEAIQHGCVPVVPDRLAYKELIPEQYRYTSDLIDSTCEREALVAALVRYAREGVPRCDGASIVKPFLWESLAPTYRVLFQELVNRVHSI